MVRVSVFPFVLAFSFSLGIVNLDFLSILVSSSCRLSVRPLDRFLLHMALPPLLLCAFLGAYTTTRIFGAKNLRKVRWQTTLKALIFVSLLIYPGVATRVFSIFRCQPISDSISVLQQDFGIACYGDEHLMFIGFAAAGLCVYIFGLPLFVFISLYCSKKSLFDSTHSNHPRTKFVLGTLYTQFEARCWWFELVNLATKMAMTGGLSVVEPGSPVQMLLAVLTMSTFLLTVVRVSPYKSAEEDFMSFLSSIALVLTTLFGLLLIMDDARAIDKRPAFNAEIIGVVLIAINSVVFVMESYPILRGLCESTCTKKEEELLLLLTCRRSKKKEEESGKDPKVQKEKNSEDESKKKKQTLTKVAPIGVDARAAAT